MLRDATQRAFFALLDESLGDDGGYTYHKSEQRLTLPNGSQILFRSLDDPDRIRGLTLAWFWLDEAPLCGHFAWQVLKGRLRQRGYLTMGWATGTPQGRDVYAYDFELAPRPNHTLYRAATQETRRICRRTTSPISASTEPFTHNSQKAPAFMRGMNGPSPA
jgi:hypothetical protein